VNHHCVQIFGHGHGDGGSGGGEKDLLEDLKNANNLLWFSDIPN
jgi:hypothetical protein